MKFLNVFCVYKLFMLNFLFHCCKSVYHRRNPGTRRDSPFAPLLHSRPREQACFVPAWCTVKPGKFCSGLVYGQSRQNESEKSGKGGLQISLSIFCLWIRRGFHRGLNLQARSRSYPEKRKHRSAVSIV